MLNIINQGSMVKGANQTIKNVYGLLALSMIPTVVGAWIGMSTGLFAAMGTGMSAIVFLVFAFGMMFLIEKNKNSQTGVYLLLGFTFGMGLFLSRLLTPVLGLAQGSAIVMSSFLGTAAIFGTMNVLSTVVKRDLGGLYKFLVVGAVAILVASLVNIFLHSSVLMMVVSALAIMIFSGFIFFEMRDLRSGVQQNYISATLSIYLSLYNVFTSLIQILTGVSLSSSD